MRIIVLLSPAKTLDLRPLAGLVRVGSKNNNGHGSNPTEQTNDMKENKNDSDTKTAASVTSSSILPKATEPNYCHHPNKTLAIVQAMKQKSEGELMKLLGISKSLAMTSRKYWKDFDTTQLATCASTKQLDSIEKNQSDSNMNTKQTKKRTNKRKIEQTDENSKNDHDSNDEKVLPKPCIFCFSGPAFQGLEASTCNSEEIEWLQRSLRIMDALYGLLRPLDVIQPYRLEMGTKGLHLPSTPSTNETKKQSNKPIKLSEYWKAPITNQLLQELTATSRSDLKKGSKKNDNDKDHIMSILLNLASDEYSSAVDESQIWDTARSHHDPASQNTVIPVQMIKVQFKEQGKNVAAVHAKRARGLMARYLAKVQANSMEQIEQFQDEGYQFAEYCPAPKEEGKGSQVNTAIPSTILMSFDRNKNWKPQQSNQSSSTGSDTLPKSEKKRRKH